jgi:hypothetical protein
VKYVVLIYNNPAFAQAWGEFSHEQLMEATRGYRELNEMLAKTGEKVHSEALAAPGEGRRVTATDGVAVPSDGPYAETKEMLAGFYVLDCASMERALELAAMIPGAAHGLVEVRPTVDLSFLGL